MAGQPKSVGDREGRIVATVDGNRLEMLETGAERLDVILRLINEAKESLRLIFYIFAEDEAGTTVRDALVAAARLTAGPAASAPAKN